MAPIISLWLGVPRPVAELCGSDFRAEAPGASCEWWACVGLEAARGPGAASFVAGRLESQVEDRTRVQPHDKLGTPVVWPRKLALITYNPHMESA